MEKTVGRAGYDIPPNDVAGHVQARRSAIDQAVALTFSSIFLASILVAWVWANRCRVATMQVVVGRERFDAAVTSQPTAAIQETSKLVTTDDVDSEATLLQGRDMLREVAQICKLADRGATFRQI